jgi:hypothetical protein
MKIKKRIKMSDDISDKKEREQSEALHKTAKLISGLIPGGGSVYDLFTALVKPLHEKRKDDWVKEVIIRLHKLETQGKINLKELSANDEFNTVITKATLQAQQEHQEEKIEALKNIVINSSFKIPQEVIDFELVDYFLSILDRVSPLHILLLKTFRDPGSAGKKKNLNLASFLTLAKTPQNTYGDFFLAIFPELESKEELVKMCWKDLYYFQLVKFDNLFVGDNLVRIGMALTTDLGNQFLGMIEKED